MHSSPLHLKLHTTLPFGNAQAKRPIGGENWYRIREVSNTLCTRAVGRTKKNKGLYISTTSVVAT